jgi:hypothetical protein
MCHSSITPEVTRAPARKVRLARANLAFITITRRSDRSAITLPMMVKSTIEMAGIPLMTPTQSLESVISKTSQAITMLRVLSPISDSPLPSQR